MHKPPLQAQKLDWSDLELILAIGRAGGLSGASRDLGQTHSTIFRRINAIEDKTGVRFFERFRKGYEPTEAGKIAIEYGERIELDFQALGREVLGQDQALEGRVRVTCPEAFAEDIAPGIMARFALKYPDISVDVSPGHGAVDMNRREAEIAIRATRTPPETSFGRRIGDFRFALYGTPAYLEENADIPLAQQRFSFIEGYYSWLIPAIWPDAQTAEAQMVFQCRASRAVLNAAAEGIGMTFLPCYVGDADDRLVRASDTVSKLDMSFWVLTHPDLRKTARIRALMSHFYDELGAQSDLFAGLTKRPDRWNFLPH